MTSGNWKPGDSMDEEEFVRHIIAGEDNFPYFVKHIFSRSFDRFIEGQHVYNTAEFLGKNDRTMRVSARDHFKSTSLYAHFMYDLIYNPGLECQYFSYNTKMAAYHGSKIKQLIEKNPFYEDCIDLKPTAEGILKYAWVEKRHEVTRLTPNGLLSFQKGIHCPRIYVDDPLREPENKLNAVVIKKINRIFVTDVMSMLKEGGQMHVIGTPQTDFDFFFDKNLTTRFEVQVLPAIKDWKKQEVLWPEHMSWEELMKRKRELGERIFNQEYMCKPVWTEQAWLSLEKLYTAVNSSLKPLKEMLKANYVVLGWDVGKKVHPSHVSIFENDRSKHWRQIYQRFLDGMSYTEQKDFVNELCRKFKVDRGLYDATRGELESFVERRELHRSLEPIIFKVQTKHDMATNFEKMIENKEVELLNDRRMLDQVLVVDNDLQALETPEGHGDSFWSIAMALWAGGNRVESFSEGV